MSDAPTPTSFQWTEEFVTQRLSALADKGRSPVKAATRLGELHEAAAVLVHFDPSDLQSFAASRQTEDTVDEVLRNSTVVYVDGSPKSTLRADARRAALKRLGHTDDVRRVLQSIPDRPRTVLQRMLDGYVLGRPKLLDLQSLDELAASLQVTQWFSGVLDTLPDRRELERRIEREALLRPFRELAGTGFAGRRAELAMLRTYVGFLQAETTFEVVARGYRELVTGYKPLVIHAPGGMGKSTLAARFVLDHLEPTDVYPALPFVYLDFDRPVLLPEQFSTLLDEAAAQLAIRFGADGDPAESRNWSARTGATDAHRLIPAFADLVGSLGLRDRPLLLVLDTFEEVQYRGRDIAEAVLAFLGRLQEAVPTLRVVVMGRAAVSATSVAVENRALGPLRRADAAAYLQERGVSDPKVASRVADQVGGSPLSLRLALEVIFKEQDALGPSGIRELTTRNALFLRVKDSEIQGQLYRRILSHVSNPDVRRLTHPGLVLRRVTPEIILDVLAEPCGVEMATIERARELFTEMAREVSLVSVNVDGSLQHVPEVRAIMLDLLRKDRPVQVREIQERAVEHYRRQPGLRERAELVYHLLMLARDRGEVDAAWQPGIEPYLRASVAELPAVSRPYLAARLGDVDESMQEQFELTDAEFRAAKRIRDLLSVHQAGDAVQLLNEVSGRSEGSVLHLPEAQARALAGDWEGARDVAARALTEAARIEDPDTVLKLEVVRAWAERELDEPAPVTLPDEIKRVLSQFDREPLAVRFALHRLAVARDEWTRGVIRHAAAEFFLRVPPVRREPYLPLCWEAAGAVGVEHPDVLFTVLEAGVPELSLDAGQALVQALSAWDREQQGQVGWNTAAQGSRVPSGADIASLLMSARSLYTIPRAVILALASVYRDAADRWRTDQHLYDELERPHLSISHSSEAL